MAYASDTHTPFPWHVMINNLGYMLRMVDAKGNPIRGDAKDGNEFGDSYHAERMPFISGTPTPESGPQVVYNPIEQPEGFYAFSGGMGFREQDHKRDRDTDGFYYGRYIDSVGDYIINGPAVNDITPSSHVQSTFGINDMFEAVVNGTRYICTVGDRYVNYRTADTAAGWANNSKDFGAGTNAKRAEVFRGTQSATYAFIALAPKTQDVPNKPAATTNAAGGTIADGTYTFCVSYTFADGSETNVSASNTQVTAGGNTSTITFTSPPAYSTADGVAATGWYAYCSQVGGVTMTRQQAAGSPTNIGTNLTITAPPTNTGIQSNTFNAFWVWDMTSLTGTWTQVNQVAIAFKRYHDQLWMLSQDTSGQYQVSQCLDGGTSPTFSGGFVVADAYNQCTDLEIHDDRLYVRSVQGLLAVSGDQLDVLDLTGGMFKYTNHTPNNCKMGAFGQFLIVPLYRSMFNYQTNGVMAEMGLGVLPRNDSPVDGIPTALVVYANWFVYVWFQNPTTSTGYLMKWGTWKFFSTLFSPIPRRVFVPAWNGALWEQTTQINSMFISEVTGQPALYMGDATGKIHWFVLSAHGPDPTNDPNYKYNTTNAFQLYCAAITHSNPGINKVSLGVELTGENLNVTVSYRLDLTGSFGGSTNLTNAGIFNSDPGERADFTTSVMSRWLDLLCTGTATSATTPCILKTVVVYQALRPVFKSIFILKLRLGSQVVNRNEMVDETRTCNDMKMALEVIQTGGPVLFVDPLGNEFLVLATKLAIDLDFWDPDRDPEFIATVELMQHISVTTAGTHQSLGTATHATLENFTHKQLTGYGG